MRAVLRRWGAYRGLARHTRSCCVAVGLATGGPAEPTTPLDVTQIPAIRTVWIRVRGVERTAFVEALALRVPHLSITPPAEPRADDAEPDVALWVDLHPSDSPSAFELSIVASDGRAFDRTISVDPAEAPTELARSVANLLLGIEAGTVAPDRANVAIPVDAMAEGWRGAPCPTPEPPPEIKTPEPVPDPIERSVRVGVGVDLAGIVGLGAPADTDRFVAWGGSLGTRIAWPKLAAFALDVRFAGRAHADGSQLVRVRVRVGAGIVLNPARTSFEFEALALISVEPWFVWLEGERVDLDPAPPALGAWLRAAPGYRFSSHRRLHGRVGFYGEFGASVVPSGDGAVAKISVDVDGQPIPRFRVGGLELAGGLEFMLWIPTSRRHDGR